MDEGGVELRVKVSIDFQEGECMEGVGELMGGDVLARAPATRDSGL